MSKVDTARKQTVGGERLDRLDRDVTTWLAAQRVGIKPVDHVKDLASCPSLATAYTPALCALRLGDREEARRVVRAITAARMVWEIYPDHFHHYHEDCRGMRKPVARSTRARPKPSITILTAE